MHLSRQLGAFIRAGLPLIEAVHTLGEEASNSSVRRMMVEVEDGLRTGEKLSDCLDRHPKIFPEFYRGILRSAELTGQLDTVLDQLARYLERDLEARRKIKSALIYPSGHRGHVDGDRGRAGRLRAAAVQGLLRQPRTPKLPLPTRILLGGHRLPRPTGGGRCSAGSRSCVLLVLALRTDRRPVRAGPLRAQRCPVLGETIRFALVERFCRVLVLDGRRRASHLPEALRVATESLRNWCSSRSLAEVREAMLRGRGHGQPAGRAPACSRAPPPR